MAHKSVIILQKPNEHVHPTYAAIMCKDFSSYFGVAAIQNGKIVTETVKGTPKAEAFADGGDPSAAVRHAGQLQDDMDADEARAAGDQNSAHSQFP